MQKTSNFIFGNSTGSTVTLTNTYTPSGGSATTFGTTSINSTTTNYANVTFPALIMGPGDLLTFTSNQTGTQYAYGAVLVM